jgi:hypothetical protein
MCALPCKMCLPTVVASFVSQIYHLKKELVPSQHSDYFVKCHHSDVAYTGQVRALSHCLTLLFTSFFPLKTTTKIGGLRKGGTRGLQHSDWLTFVQFLSSAQ